MPKYHVTLNEIVARTYEFHANDKEHAVELARRAPPYLQVYQEFVDYWCDVNLEEDVIEVGGTITHDGD